MDLTNKSGDSHPESQPELGFGMEPTDQPEPEARMGADPPPPPSPSKPKRKITRRPKPKLPENPPESAPAPEKNGQLQEAASTNQAADDWDLDSLRVSQDYASGLGVEQAVTDVPVSKPSKSQWVRTHPDLK